MFYHTGEIRRWLSTEMKQTFPNYDEIREGTENGTGVTERQVLLDFQYGDILINSSELKML
jgi:hypothetical protein